MENSDWTLNPWSLHSVQAESTHTFLPQENRSRQMCSQKGTRMLRNQFTGQHIKRRLQVICSLGIPVIYSLWLNPSPFPLPSQRCIKGFGFKITVFEIQIVDHRSGFNKYGTVKYPYFGHLVGFSSILHC